MAIGRVERRALEAARTVAEKSGRPWPSIDYDDGGERAVVNYQTISSLVDKGLLAKSVEEGVVFYEITKAGRKVLARARPSKHTRLTMSESQRAALNHARIATAAKSNDALLGLALDGDREALSALDGFWPYDDDGARDKGVRCLRSTFDGLVDIAPRTGRLGPRSAVDGLIALLEAYRVAKALLEEKSDE